MLRNTVFCIFLAAVAGSASAQSPTIDYADYVEAARPRLSFRALSADEQKKAAAAVRLWGSKKKEANLGGVRPYAEAGDVGSLQAMMEGYIYLRTRPDDRGGSAALTHPDHALTALAALWATAYWTKTGGSFEAARALAPCMTNNRVGPLDKYDYHKTIKTISSQGKDFDCGFEARATDASFDAFKSELDKKKAPKQFLPITFVETPLRSQSDLEIKRLNAVIAQLENEYVSTPVSQADLAWLYAKAARDPVVDARVKEAKLERSLRGMAAGGADLAPNDELRQYIQADPKRIQRYEAAQRARQGYAFNNAVQVSSMLASASPGNREASSWLAIKSPSTANQWWKAYSGNLSGNVPHAAQWCTSGVQEACGVQKAAETAAAFRDKYGDPASIGSAGYVGPIGGIDQGQFSKERAAGAVRCQDANIAGVDCKR